MAAKGNKSVSIKTVEEAKVACRDLIKEIGNCRQGPQQLMTMDIHPRESNDRLLYCRGNSGEPWGHRRLHGRVRPGRTCARLRAEGDRPGGHHLDRLEAWNLVPLRVQWVLTKMELKERIIFFFLIIFVSFFSYIGLIIHEPWLAAIAPLSFLGVGTSSWSRSGYVRWCMCSR